MRSSCSIICSIDMLLFAALPTVQAASATGTLSVSLQILPGCVHVGTNDLERRVEDDDDAMQCSPGVSYQKKRERIRATTLTAWERAELGLASVAVIQRGEEFVEQISIRY